MIATVHTGSLSGVDAQGVVVEIGQARGLPGFDIVGQQEAALRESRVRVMAAISNSGYQLPRAAPQLQRGRVDRRRQSHPPR